MTRLTLFLLLCTCVYAALPTTTSVTPNAASGVAASFATVSNDANGYADLTSVELLINNSLASTNGCHVSYLRASNQLQLRSDNTLSLAGVVTPGVRGYAQNSQCVISGIGSSVSGAGNSLTVTVNVTLKAGWTGTKNLYLRSQDAGSGISGWTDHGDFTYSYNPVAYYVDNTNGSNANAGTSPGTAWKTAAKVSNSSFNPGDMILFKRGEVWREALTMPSSGAYGYPITVGDYGTGALPVLNGAELVTGWTRDSGSIYYAAQSFTSNAVWQNGSTHIKAAASKAAMVAGTFFYDSAASKLYVWTSTGASPAGFTIEATRYPNQYYGLLSAINKSYLTIQNLHIVKSNYHDILLHDGGSGHTVRWNTLDQSYHSSIQVAGQLGERNLNDIDVLYNTITDSGRGRVTNPAVQECVGINFQGVQTGSAVGNVITNQGGEGIQNNAGASNILFESNRIINPYMIGLYIGSGWGNHGNTTNTTARYNYVELGPQSTSTNYCICSEDTWADAVDGVSFHHNISKGNGTAKGGLLFGSGSFTGVIRNTAIYNNVFVNDSFVGIKAFGPTDGANNVFRNNIFSVGSYGRAYWIGAPAVGTNPLANYDMDYDVMYSPNANSFIVEWGTGSLKTLNQWRTDAGRGSHSIVSDPLFSNPAEGDYSLQKSSPAVNTGVALTGAEQERQGAAPDIGAYEYIPGKLGTARSTKLRNRYRAVYR